MLLMLCLLMFKYHCLTTRYSSHAQARGCCKRCSSIFLKEEMKRLAKAYIMAPSQDFLQFFAESCSFCRFFCQSSQSGGRLCSMWHQTMGHDLQSMGKNAENIGVPRLHPNCEIACPSNNFCVLARNFGTGPAISEPNEMEHSGSNGTVG